MRAEPQRLEALRHHWPEGLGALVVSQDENRRYLSGFTGSAGVLVITGAKAFLLTDFRYVEQAVAEAPDVEVVHFEPRHFFDTLEEILAAHAKGPVGVEAASLSHQAFSRWQEKLKVKLQPTLGLVEKLRQVKGPEEVQRVRQAMQLAEEAFLALVPQVRPGTSERELALELEFRMRRAGAERAAFPFIVASGPRSSLPHAQPTNRRLCEGDFVTFDFGAVFDGYASDITRTVLLGKASPQQREVYQLVLEAQLEALEALRPGVSGVAVDRVARNRIEAGGYGDRFGHGLGHGVGLDVHEEPRLSPSASEDELLKAGMVVTVEPGIYIPAWGGVRIEDLVLITDDGYEVFSHTSKELMIL